MRITTEGDVLRRLGTLCLHAVEEARFNANQSGANTCFSEGNPAEIFSERACLGNDNYFSPAWGGLIVAGGLPVARDVDMIEGEFRLLPREFAPLRPPVHH